jgi:predicted Na+-dependent transporter
MASIWIQVLSSILLFCLVFGMTATVEVSHMKKQIHNRVALCIGACIQFIILPLIGCLTVLIFHLPIEIGITLLVITSSPGGSYSNWWCSMFNADLALSVTMTALSTILATIMLPINLLLYTRWIYSASVLQSLDWTSLFISLIVVLSGIISGLGVSQYTMNKHLQQQRNQSNNNNKTDAAITPIQSIDDMRRNANRMGNCAGLALILLSVTVSSSNQNARLWDQDISFYMAGAIPPIIGLLIAVSLASHYKLDKPECVAVSIESCYQNTGIATTVALTMFQNDIELTATAIGVPLYYGIIEAVVIFTFCIICWKIGWTKAPSNENICKVITTSYEVEQHSDTDHEQMDVEIVYGGDHSNNRNNNNNNGEMYIDMIFSKQTDTSEYIVDEQTLHVNYDMNNTSINTVNDNKYDALDCSSSLSFPIDECDKNNIGNTSMELDGIIRYKKQPLHTIPDSPTVTDSPTLTEVTDISEYSNNDNDTITNIDHIRMKSRLGGGRKTLSNIRAFATGYRRPLPIVPCDDDDGDVKYIFNNGSNDDIIPTSSSLQEQTSCNNQSIDTNQLSSSTESTTITTNATKKISDVIQKANHNLVVKRQRKNKYYETIYNHHSPSEDDNNHIIIVNDTSIVVNNYVNALDDVIHTNHNDDNDDEISL